MIMKNLNIVKLAIVKTYMSGFTASGMRRHLILYSLDLQLIPSS